MRHALAAAALAALAVCATAVAAPAAPAGPPLLVISIDGLHPSYVLEADRLGLRVPNLRALLRDGAHATAVTGVMPTVTYVSHTTIVTGASPARHGIVANNTFDPLGKNLEGWYWYADDIQVETLWDAAAKAGLVTSSRDWPVTVGARLTWNIAQVWRANTPDDAKLVRVVSTPGLLKEAEAAVGRWPSGYAYEVKDDQTKAAFDVWMIETKKPRLHLAYFSGLDEEQHEHGPYTPPVLAGLEAIDALVGRLRAAVEKAGGGRATVAVVSDHGHTTTSKELHLNEALREAGLLWLDGRGKVTEWRAFAWLAGGSAGIYLKDPADQDARASVARILDTLQRDPTHPIARVWTADEIATTGGFPGAAFLVSVPADTRLGGDMDGKVLRPGVPRGSHGHAPDLAAVDASFFIAGPGIPAGLDLGRIDMRDVGPTLAGRLGLVLSAAEGKNLLAARPGR
jgi:predicted AlkP superfamily pyrophosphatase or phosphodiesterase